MKTQAIAYIGIMLAVLIVLGYVPPIVIGVIPVPIVMQNMGIFLTGLLLGQKKGTITVLLLLIMVSVGLPVLSGGSGGVAVFYGPTGGYVVGYLIAVTVIGYGRDRLSSKVDFIRLLLLTLFGGVFIINLCGSVALHWHTGISLKTALLSNVVFIPGDLIKSVISVIVMMRIPQQMRVKLMKA